MDLPPSFEQPASTVDDDDATRDEEVRAFFDALLRLAERGVRLVDVMDRCYCSKETTADPTTATPPE